MMNKARLFFKNRHARLWSLLAVLFVLAMSTFLLRTNPQKENLWMPIAPSDVSQRLFLLGKIASAQEEILSAPFEGVIAERFAQEAERVQKGQAIMRFDTSQIDIALREARSTLLKAQKNKDDIDHWEKSPEMARARRSLSSITLNLEDAKHRLADTTHLFEQGIVPRMEVDTLAQLVKAHNLEKEAAQSELLEVAKKGNLDARQLAQLELENAHARYTQLLTQKEKETLIAPSDGILLKIDRAANEASAPSLQKGGKVLAGQALFQIVSLEHLKVASFVEEMDVHHIKEGLPVTLSGDGFEGLELAGKVRFVGSQAAASDMGNPRYEVFIDLLPIAETEAKTKLRLGMSAKVAIDIYQKKDALLLPHSALQKEGDAFFVTYKENESSMPKRLPVAIGKSTPSGVEVSGLPQAGFVLLKAPAPSSDRTEERGEALTRMPMPSQPEQK